MSEPLPIQLATRSAPARDGQEGAARLVNCYAESTPDGKNPFAIYASSGLTLKTTLTEGPLRAFFALPATMIAVAGRVIYTIDSGYGVAQIGGIPTDGLVTMAENRRTPQQVAICSDGLLTIYSDGVLTDVTDPDLKGPISVTELDGYIITLASDGTWQLSEIDDATSFDAILLATAESRPDGGVRNITRGRDVLIFGQKSCEFYQNTGADPFPFSRVTTIDNGCFAAGSVVSMTAVGREGPADDTVIFAATNRDGAYCGVMRLSGYTPVKISDYELDRIIEAEPTPENIRAFSWSERGHSFYAISGTDWTRVYDATEGLWHDRESYGESRWRASCYCHFASKHVIGDFETGAVYEMSADVYDENGDPLVMSVVCPPAHAFPFGLTWDEVVIDAVKGVGLVSTSSHLASPVLMLDYSDDGGKNYSAVREIGLGAAAQVRQLLKRHRFGSTARGAARTWRMRCSASVFRAIMSLSAFVTRDAA